MPATDEIAPRKAYLKRLLEIVADHPNTLGYWLFDEPENALYKAYRQWEERRDAGLAAWIVDGMKWSYETIRRRDPDGLVMPTIAWYTTYEDLAPLYDVNVPNDYPPKTQHAVMEAPLYNVVYDAMRAADASRATGKPCFIYMPGTYDIIGGGLRASTEAELRYQMFAPITQGAMGVLSWRLGRCTPRYRQAVVYPVMREIRQLTPWLLGSDRTATVTSNRDQPGIDYLKAFPERIRTVANEEIGPLKRVKGVPDCSYCLKRRPNNSYLLLAVNNRKEPISATFSLHDIQHLPPNAMEMLEYREVPVVDGMLTDRFAPFGVHAYVFDVL